MTKRVLLVEQYKHRAFKSNMLVGAYLEALGYDPYFSFTGAQLVHNINRVQPDLVYYPWVTETVHDYIKDRNPDVPIVNIFQEQFIVIHKQSQKQLNDVRTYSDYVFAWSERLAEEMVAEGIDREKIRVTGNPRYDFYRNDDLRRALFPSRSELANAYDLPEDRRWALFAMDFFFIFKPEDRINELVRSEDFPRDYFERTRESYRRVNNWLRSYLESHDSPFLILRPHPGSDLPRLKREQGIASHDNVAYVADGQISPWLIHADRFFTRISTSLIEAWIADVETFVVSDDLSPGRIHMHEANNKANKYDEFETYLAGDMDDGTGDHESFLQTYFHRLDGNASLRTAQEIDRILQDTTIDASYRRVPGEDLKNTVKSLGKGFLNRSGLIDLYPFSELTNREYIPDWKMQRQYREIKEAVQKTMRTE